MRQIEWLPISLRQRASKAVASRAPRSGNSTIGRESARANGAGKSNFVELILAPLRPGVTFVNADVIAAQWPVDPVGHAYEAARVAADRLCRRPRSEIGTTESGHSPCWPSTGATVDPLDAASTVPDQPVGSAG